MESLGMRFVAQDRPEVTVREHRALQDSAPQATNLVIFSRVERGLVQLLEPPTVLECRSFYLQGRS